MAKLPMPLTNHNKHKNINKIIKTWSRLSRLLPAASSSIRHTQKTPKTRRDLDRWPTTLKFNRVVEVVKTRASKIAAS